MSEEIILPVEYKGENFAFPASVKRYAFGYKLEVEIKETKITFEPDEERNWRAVIGFEDLLQNKVIDKGLLEAIARVINQVT